MFGSLVDEDACEERAGRGGFEGFGYKGHGWLCIALCGMAWEKGRRVKFEGDVD